MNWFKDKARDDAIKHGILESAPGELEKIQSDNNVRSMLISERKTERDNWQRKHNAEIKIRKPRSDRSLTDEQAIICRKECYSTSTRLLAHRFKVSENTIIRCINGFTYKHLDHICKPRI